VALHLPGWEGRGAGIPEGGRIEVYVWLFIAFYVLGVAAIDRRLAAILHARERSSSDVEARLAEVIGAVEQRVR